MPTVVVDNRPAAGVPQEALDQKDQVRRPDKPHFLIRSKELNSKDRLLLRRVDPRSNSFGTEGWPDCITFKC